MPDDTHGLAIADIHVGETPEEDVLQADPVATAAEACLPGAPALAVSLAGMDPSHYANAARVTAELIARTDAGGLS